mmetsp:Transcript_24981/g.38785  ORF Transcript_24981/g.38785 Transcript_24981/m.38785 type:complete len:140 (+) Transcript_24981:931-1350(+)
MRKGSKKSELIDLCRETNRSLLFLRINVRAIKKIINLQPKKVASSQYSVQKSTFMKSNDNVNFLRKLSPHQEDNSSSTSAIEVLNNLRHQSDNSSINIQSDNRMSSPHSHISVQPLSLDKLNHVHLRSIEIPGGQPVSS